MSKSDSHPEPNKILETNILGTINIIEAALRLKNLKRLVYFSTGEIYGDSNSAIKESLDPRPKSFYANSKFISENILRLYSSKNNLPITIIRLFNTYGPRKKDNVIFFFIKSALKDDKILINGKGDQLRDFLYIDDAIKAFLLVGCNENSINETVNIGGGIQTKIKDLAEKIKYLTKSSSRISYCDVTPGLMCFYCDNSKVTKEYNWKPKIDLDSGLKRTIEWVKQNEGSI